MTSDAAVIARDVIALVRFGVPFAEARAMPDDVRRAYLDAFMAERSGQAWKSGLPKAEEPKSEPGPIPGLSTIG